MTKRTPCGIDGCNTPAYANRLCGKHHSQWRRASLQVGWLDEVTRPMCRVSKCQFPVMARGLCDAHYQRMQRTGHTDGKPGRHMTPEGYVVVRCQGHVMANVRGEAMEHRVAMADHLGRALLPHESVHHINGDRGDNRIENLELWSKSQPYGQRVSDKIAWAKEILALYEPDALA